ncbi:MAG TPA: hypothetical protein VD969_28770 [Symbiobacteriaceae bacterium]|nr:hypothetical protein [Symbiobacteriaceae bacterium]
MRRAMVLGWLAAVLLLLAGCRAARPQPEFDFTVEQKGAGLTVRVETGTFRVPQDGHVHIRLDDGPETMIYSKSYTIPKVALGTHRITIQLSDPRHNYFGVSKEKTVDIK